MNQDRQYSHFKCPTDDASIAESDHGTLWLVEYRESGDEGDIAIVMGQDSEEYARLFSASVKVLEALKSSPIVRVGETIEGFTERYSLWWRETKLPAIAKATGGTS